ncbi:MATE family efflux transporter [Clostridium beijerinckii]|jgi:putative MATE family efflux protein|uniref:MATE family efflux transporter n=2 Tax=Clostridium beijerinckii TaxID=1520 RepID=A0A1S8QRR7_CLOBE|nr:MATE family efflux transporter [Clostridium beijerinckii]ABR35280.1 MATE efflux family protein [Clostridium beijerinckii NCIMB 8052]AIU04403.1 MATE efflux family protein [Clostridium beijerinckii ATCC 35702]MBF7810083.1 MATE family efflux transporter [Clostridium beijerinckii]NOW90703.1 putative MATE family efflux protein [Clostridium beijerinckii]NRT23321.1 putative MATE family efflux protein [Clostridium beijerinckii]
MKGLKKINFLEGDVKNNLLTLFIPLLISFFLSMAFDINDSIWIGNILGKNALAAQTVSMPLILLYNSICMGVTGGIGILVSQAIGSKNNEKCAKIISTSFVMVLVLSLVITVICELGINTILFSVDTPASIYDDAKSFLQIHILSFVFMMIFSYFAAVMRSYGNSIFQLISIIICTLLNAVLDPIFIYFYGLNGVAAATVLAECILIIIVYVYYCKNKFINIKPSLFDSQILKSIISKAVPSMFQQSLPAISTTFVTTFTAGFGITAIAGLGTATKIETLLLYPSMAMNMAISAAAGQCFGGHDVKKAREYSKWGIILGGGLVSVFTLLVILFSKYLSFIFGADIQVSEIVSSYFIIISIGYVCNMITNSMLGAINGFGKPASAMYLMIFYYIIVRIPLAKLLSTTSLGLNGLWFAVLISHIAAAIASVLFYKQITKAKIREEASLKQMI